MEILFSTNHVWIKKDGETATLGISAYAQDKLGTVMFINLPEIGDLIMKGSKFGDVESIKTVSDLVSPVTGEVLDINEVLMDEPDSINEHPYDAWLIKVKISDEEDGLLKEEEYNEYCKTL